MSVGDLIKFKYEGYNKAYGLGIVIEIEYDLGDYDGAAYGLFANERLMFRFSEVERVSASR